MTICRDVLGTELCQVTDPQKAMLSWQWGCLTVAVVLGWEPVSFLWELNWLPPQVAGVSGSDSPLEDLLVHLRKHYAFVVPRGAFASPAAVGTLSRQTPSQFAVSFSALWDDPFSASQFPFTWGWTGLSWTPVLHPAGCSCLLLSWSWYSCQLRLINTRRNIHSPSLILQDLFLPFSSITQYTIRVCFIWFQAEPFPLSFLSHSASPGACGWDRNHVIWSRCCSAHPFAELGDDGM